MISAPREPDSRARENALPGNYFVGDDAPATDADHEVLSPRTPGLIHMEPDTESEPPAPSGRRAARAAAVQALYEAESTGHPALTALDRVAERDGLSDDLRKFAARLVGVVETSRLALDDRIAKLAPARPIEMIDPVVRAILRLAIAELTLEDDDPTPPAVIVNECVEIARLYGSESSPRFVNGVLGTVLR